MDKLQNVTFASRKYDKEFETSVITELIRNRDRFGELMIEKLEPTYFTYDALKLLLIEIKNYYKKYDSMPNFDNFQNEIVDSKLDEVTKNLLKKTLKYCHRKVKRIEKGELNDDSEANRSKIHGFVKTREYMRLAAFIFNNSQDMDDNSNNSLLLANIDDRVRDIMKLDDDSGYGTMLFDKKNFIIKKKSGLRISTMLPALDEVLDGGYEKSRIYAILAPSGVGKSTLMTYFSKVFLLGYNVLYVTLEDPEEDVKRKMYASLTSVNSNDLEEHQDKVLEELEKIENDETTGNYVIKSFNSGELSPKKLQTWKRNYEKHNRMKFDVMFIDYVECMCADKVSDNQWKDEEKVVRGLERIAIDDECAVWYAVQAHTAHKYVSTITTEHAFGSKEKVKKAHVIITMGKSMEQKQEHLGNIVLEKSKISMDGIIFEDSIINNGTLQIVLKNKGQAVDTSIMEKGNDIIRQKVNTKKDIEQPPLEDIVDENDFTKIEAFNNNQDFDEPLVENIELSNLSDEVDSLLEKEFSN